MERTIKLTKNLAKIKTLLSEREQLNDQAIDFNKRMEELEREGSKLQQKIQKIKDKVAPLVGPELNGQLGEFEAVSTVKLVDGEPVATIIDRVEDFKAAIRKQKEEANKKA